MNRRVNFLLAIAACFLCVQTFWADDLAAVDKQDKKKEEPADKQAKQIELLQQINRLQTEQIQVLAKEMKKLMEDNKRLAAEIAAIAKDKTAAQKAAEDLRMKFELDVLMAELNKKEAQEQNKRLRVEVEAMVKALQRSEADKLTLVDTLNKMTRDAIFAKNETAAMRARLDQVEQQLRDTQKRLNEAGGKKGAVDFGPRAGNDANPPAVKVKGSITKIAEDKNDGAGVLAEISVGADHGVNVNHTLEVYRAAPKPDYVGRLRILSVTEKTSIGRLISPGGAGLLKVGDVVVERLD